MTQETPFTFTSHGDRLIGMIHAAENPARIGLLIVVGGPQYRVGACRQYVHLARVAADKGIAAMRFDYRGIGDSGGDYPGFQNVGPDIEAAITEFMERVPGMEGVVLWGLCEGASAILLDGVRNPNVKGIVLANPWVNTAETQAKAYLKHYYGSRFLDPEIWKRLMRGDINILKSLTGILGLVRKTFGRAPETARTKPYPQRMAEGFEQFKGQTLLIMSGRDLVAREFEDVTGVAPEWQAFRESTAVMRADIAGSDHTFSKDEWRSKAATHTADFVLALAAGGQDHG
jgi:exosortase A-associated hydrolase 1